MVSGGWALPAAGVEVFGRHSVRLIPLYVSGGIIGVLWAWYCKKLQRFLHYLAVLALSIALQFLLYRLLIFLFGLSL